MLVDMPRSSRHKSHKQNKRSSKENSDSEDGVKKVKERTGKDESSTMAHGDSTSGEKRKISSQTREGREKESSFHVNDEVSEDYVSSKCRKRKSDDYGDDDRWNGGGDAKDISDRGFEKELDKGHSMKVDVKHKDKSSKGECLKFEHKNKSKRNERAVRGDRMEDSAAPLVVEIEEKSRSVSKRKSDKDSSVSKDGRDSKDKDPRSEKEKKGGHSTRSGDGDVKVVDWDSGKKQGTSGGERQSKRPRDDTENISKKVLQSNVPEKEYEKLVHRKREGSSEREKHSDDFREGGESLGATKAEYQIDEKNRDEKYKDRRYAEKGLEDSRRSERRKDENYHEESDKDYRYHDDKYQDYGHQEDGERDTRRRDEKHRGDGECDTKRKHDKHREGLEDRRDDKYHEDADRSSRRKDHRYHDDGEKDIRGGNDRDVEDGGHGDKHRGDAYRERGERDYRHKDEKYRDDAKKDIRHNANLGDEIDLEKRQRESKYDHDFRDRSGGRADIKHSSDDIYIADGHARKSSAYDESPNDDSRTVRYKDDQNRKRTNEKADCGESKSRSAKDQRSDSGKKSGKLDPASNKMRATSRNADFGHSSHSKRRGSPSSSSHVPRDNHRSLKQDESKYRDYNIDERPREHASSLERSEKTASRSLEKLSPNDYSQLREVPAERHLKSDNHSSPLRRTGGSRDRKGEGSREAGLDVAPLEERIQADDDALLISSPSVKNNNLSSNLRSLPPPHPFRSVVSPLPLGSADDDGRGKSHNHHRRIGVQGNVWRGVPTWTSPIPNGFLPFPPHAPPPVGFHPVMPPFHTPPMFGVRPSMDVNLHSSYQMQNFDRYFGPMPPMGWQNHVDDTCAPMQTWDGTAVVFGDESRIYGRPDWDQSRNRHVWDESTSDVWKGANNDKGLEALSVGKENISSHGGDEGSQSIQPTQSDRNLLDQQADSTDIHLSAKIIERNNAAVPRNSVVDNAGFTDNEMLEPVHFSIAYLSKLDVSADLAEPELFSKFTDLISKDKFTISYVDDYKIFYVEDSEAKISAISSPSSALLPSMDDSVFQKSIALYKKQKETVQPNDAARVEFIESDPKSGMHSTHIKSENPCLADNGHGLQDGLPSIPSELDPSSCSPTRHSAVDELAADVTLKTEEELSILAEIDTEIPENNNLDIQPSSDAASYPDEKDEYTAGCENKGMKSVGSAEFGALVNSEANLPASLSRIHHSPESTH